MVVSHDPAFIREQCDTAILLEQGSLIGQGPAADVVRLYGERLAAARAIIDREMIERLEGRVVRGDGPVLDEQRLFLVRDGHKHWIEHPNWLTEAGVRWPDGVVFLPAGSLYGLPDGEAVE